MGHGFTTRQIHDRTRPQGARPRATPIYLSAGFSFDEFEEAEQNFVEGIGYGYTRIANPTIDEVESSIAALEGGTKALLLSSGQAATTVAILSAAGSGDHVVASTHIYEGTRGLLVDTLSRFGITVDFVSDIDDPDAWRALIGDRTRALFAESVSNGANRVLDTPAIAALAHEYGIPLIVDNTLPTPYLVRPLEQGADLVVHSASKFLAGHGAVIGGVVIDAGRFDAERNGHLFPHLTKTIRGDIPSVADRAGGDALLTFGRENIAPRLGTTLSPFNAFLIGQGLETLSLRVARQAENALALATFLESRPEVESVDFAGLASHPDHDLAERDLPLGVGSVFTFTLRGGRDAARRVVQSLGLFTHMAHLGDVRSLVLHPETTSHILLSPEERSAVGVEPGTLRLAIGIEDIDDLLEDFAAALDGLAEAESPSESVAEPPVITSHTEVVGA